MPCEGCRPEKRSKRISFLSVKVNLERSRIIHRAKPRFSVVRNEIILIVRHIAQHVERPQLRWAPGHHQLIIEKVRSIFSVRVEGSQKVTRGLVTSRGHRRKMLVPPPHIKATSQHRTVDCGLPLFRSAISDVEHRRHFVAIFRLKTAGRELDALNHRTVGHRKALLLAGAHQLRSIKFDSIEINHIFVKRSAAHIVLR